MLIALAVFVNEYYKFKRANTLNLKLAQKSPIWNKINQILSENFNYYRNLPDDLKTNFALRVFYFMQQMTWIASGNPRVSLHQRTLISASAIQLTFGLDNISFGRFKTILVHNDAYYNRFTKQYHRGEVNQAGLIVLSWKHFEQGYADDSDKINLGLHEMAHALDLALHLAEGRRYHVHRLMDKFRQSAFNKVVAMRKGADSFFRSYAATNSREFFSVAVEHFFEAPNDFKEKVPELYTEMCHLLNQDPCNKVYRGFKSPYKKLYSNAIKKDVSSIYKPKLVLKPNINIFVPHLLFALLFALTYPVINTFSIINSLYLSLVITMVCLAGLYIIYNAKGRKLMMINDYLITKNYILNNKLHSLHLKNIVNITFTYMLTYYKANISYFEGEQIINKSLSLYFSPASIKKLERLLLQQDVKIKHNNKWLKKDSF